MRNLFFCSSRRFHQSKCGKNTSFRCARLAIAVVFFINGMVFSNWVSRIPSVQQSLGLSTGALGLALWATAIGAFFSQPCTGWLVHRVGSRRVTTFGALLYCSTLALPVVALNLPTLMLALFALGASNGVLDVAMNVQGIAVEQHSPLPIFSSLHAVFSFGGLAGSLLGGLFAALGVAPLPHLLIVSLLNGVIVCVASRWLLSDEVKLKNKRGMAPFPHLSGRLLMLGIIAFCALLSEGTVADWSAVYLKNWLHTGPGLAAGGFAAFSLTMAFGRLLGDRLSQRWGPVALARGGGLLATAGMLLLLFVDQSPIAIMGFGLFGAGLSCIFPVILRAAGHLAPGSTASAIAFASTMGYVGFLAGPPLIGFVAELTTLPRALGIVVIFSLTISVLAGSISPSSRQR